MAHQCVARVTRGECVCVKEPATRADVPQSPTLSAASTAISEPHHYQQPIIQKEPSRGVQGMTTESYQSQQDHSTHPISGRRQDSAVSKEGSTFAPPSEPGLSYSHRSPTYSHHSPSSSLAAQLITQPSAPAHSSAASIYPSPAPFDHVTSPVGHSNGHSDHSNTGNTRQQRYNVRFAANYTSANMPPVQRSRQSPPLPAATSPQETNGPPTPPDRPQSPSDLKIQEWLVGSKKKPDMNAQPISNPSDSAGEKCQWCHMMWKRQPLDESSTWAQQETARSIQDFAKATDKHISGLRQHARDNEVEYEKWKTHHSTGECVKHKPLPETNGYSNKRKSEVPHSDMPKVPKITHDNHGPTAPAIRP